MLIGKLCTEAEYKQNERQPQSEENKLAQLLLIGSDCVWSNVVQIVLVFVR